jgi:hypothetical protein
MGDALFASGQIIHERDEFRRKLIGCCLPLRSSAGFIAACCPPTPPTATPTAQHPMQPAGQAAAIGVQAFLNASGEFGKRGKHWVQG